MIATTPYLRLTFFGIALALLLSERSALADPETDAMKARLQALEARLDSLRNAGPGPRKTDSGGATAQAGGRESNLAIGGLIQAQAEFGDQGDSRYSADDDRFFLRRARLNAAGRFPEGFEFRLELDLSGSAGQVGGLRAQMTDGYAAWIRHPEATVRVGQFKTAFGHEQLVPDPRLATIERSLPNDRLTLGRQIGAQVSGDFRGKRVGYAAGLFNGTGTNTTANDDDNFLYVGRVTGVPVQDGARDLRVSAGAATYTSRDHAATGLSDLGFDSTPDGKPDNVFVGKRRGWNGDAEFHYGRYDLWLEVLGARFEPDNAIPRDRLDAAGGLAQAAAFLVPKKFQVVLKYDFLDTDRGSGGNTVETVMVGLNDYVRGDDVKLQVGHFVTRLPGRDGREHRTLLRLQTVF